MANYNTANTAIPEEERSYFDGGYFAYIGYTLLVAFVSVITLGIAYPWMCCLFQKWKAKHTVVCGKRMYFDGTGLQLVGKYLLWWLLSVITFGIYGLWMSISMKKWITKHTHYQGEEDNNSYFDGGVLGMFGTNLLATLVLAVPFVGFAWSSIIKRRWESSHTVVDSRRHIFVGSVGNLFVKKLLWGLLTGITFGIYGLFVPVKEIRWETENTIDNEHTTQEMIARGEYRANVHADAAAFKACKVEDDMECVKAGITDAMAEDALLAMANSGVRAAQYTYVARYSQRQYTQEPFTSLLQAAAAAEYAPAMSLYLQTHLVEDSARTAMLTKAADKGQIWAIRTRMAELAQEALAMPEDKAALPVLKSAVRYADLLRESQEPLTEAEEALIKKCVFAIRRIQSKMPPSNRGKIVGIVVGVLVGLPILIALIAGAAALLTNAIKAPTHAPGSYDDIGSGMVSDANGMAAAAPEGNGGILDVFSGLFGGGDDKLTNSGMGEMMAPAVDSNMGADSNGDSSLQATETSDFWKRFVNQMEADDCVLTTVDTASNGTVKYALTCNQYFWSSLHYIEVLQTADGIEHLSLYGVRVYEPDSPDPTMNQTQWESIIRVIYKELGLGDYEGITPYTANGEHSEAYGQWLLTYSNTDQDVRLTVTKN